MRPELQKICDNYIINRTMIKSTFSFEDEYMYSVAATIFADKGMLAGSENLKKCRDILKADTGVFSNFRGNVKLPMISILAVSDSPEDKMKRVIEIHKALRKNFFGSEFLPVAAMALDELDSQGDYKKISDRSRNIYNLMKQEHPFLTSSEDSVFAALLALSDSPDSVIVAQMEQAYVKLREVFKDRNAVQTLSHVIVLLGGDIIENCNRTIELYNRIRNRKHKYGKSFELAVLAILSLVDDMDRVVDDIIETDNFLSKQKGYGFLGIDKIQRIMHAAILVSKDYVSGDKSQLINTALLGGTVSLVIAEQAAFLASIAAANAAAAASASSN